MRPCPPSEESAPAWQKQQQYKSTNQARRHEPRGCLMSAAVLGHARLLPEALLCACMTCMTCMLLLLLQLLQVAHAWPGNQMLQPAQRQRQHSSTAPTAAQQHSATGSPPCPLTWAMPRGPTGTTILPWGHSLSTSDLGSSSAAAPTWMAW
jgi:hypothetical protein